MIAHAGNYTDFTPALLDLMEHEKVIEQGLHGFLETGDALLTIREGKKYRAAGFSTFETYCSQRWGISVRRARHLMDAVQIVDVIENGNSCSSFDLPTHESQVRPLALLKGDPEAVREAYAEAVDEAGGEQPTAVQVRRAVERRLPPKKDHPAPFSDPILAKVAEKVQGAETVLDPFAGTGRVHELRERANVANTIGVELEPEWAAKHPDTIEGNALDLPLDDESVDAIATSPTYGNRMADHHEAKDDSVRLTYKHTLGRELHEDNSGAMQWGDEYRAFHVKAWTESARVLKPGGTFVINIKDHIRAGEKQEVAAWHINTMCRAIGLDLVALDLIPTKGLMTGENHDTKTTAELVLTFRKPAP